ncbi:NPCBM/NEW2 domain-containing protein [Flammeovirga sp. OC4]|uniref:NPCBM/NEW2 domain-containing protein n=1 Tax=Flammeovirga sp. OC4 TaxID=1382345 RepID=UPI0005C570F1|nr:NPCBM/NEW2 domain-containing protein [Flammeovirga sp. OC4]
MKNITFYFLFFLLTITQVHGQECKTLIDDDFEVETDMDNLPSYISINTSGNVNGGDIYFKEGMLHMETPAGGGHAKANINYEAFSQSEFEISFRVKSNNSGGYTFKMDFLDANNKCWIGLKYPDYGKRDLRWDILENGSVPGGSNFPEEHSLLDADYAVDTWYEIRMVFNANHQVAIYLNGVLKFDQLPLPEVVRDSPITTIKMYSQGSKNNGVITFFDYFKTVEGPQLNKDLISQSILDAENFLAIKEGSGQYSQEAIDQLKADIATAKSKMDDCSLSQEELDAAATEMDDALDHFKSQVIIIPTDVTVTVDWSSMLMERKAEWHGANSTYNADGQGLWNPILEDLDPRVIDLANYTGSAFFRFPGGTMANLYNWKRAIGPTSERVDNLDAHSNGKAFNNNFGPDEFGKLLNTTYLNKGSIVVPFAYGTPQDAADFVEYMNAEVGANPNGGKDWALERAKNGQYEPYNINVWEVGNELYGDWELSVLNYPLNGDDVRGGDAIRSGDARFYVYGGTESFTNQRAVKQTTWVAEECTLDGTPEQEFKVKFPPIDLSQEFKVSIDGEVWTEVLNFDNSSATDKHFVVTSGTDGTFKFGDGVNGAIPESLGDVLVNYTSGPHAGFSEYYAAMKAVDPSITVVSSFEHENFFKYMADENEPYDAVAKHYYPGGEASSGQEYIFELSQIAKYNSKVDEFKEYLEKYDNTSLTDIHVQQFLSEYGTPRNFSAIPHAIVLWHQMMNNYKDEVLGIQTHSFFKNDGTTMVETRFGGFLKAKGYAHHIFTHLHQDQFVKADFEGEKYTHKNAEIWNSYPTASVNEENTIATVVIPNTSDGKQLNTTFDFTTLPFEMNDKVVLKKWIALADDINVDNTSDNPTNIRIEGPVVMDNPTAFTFDKVAPYTVAIYQWEVVDTEEFTYLSEIQPRVNLGELKVNQGFSEDSVLMINGSEQYDAVTLSYYTEVEYNVKRYFDDFEAEIGLEDNFLGGSAVLKVFGDDELLYESAPITANTPIEKISVDVRDVETLKITTSPSSGLGFNVGVANARLYKNENYQDDVTSVEIDRSSLKIAPNPFQTNVHITLPKVVTGTLTIHDSMGRMITQQSLQNEIALDLNLSQLNQGLYIISITNADEVFVGKLLKSN